ncbi:hypothetical protein DFJ67_5605 [Asanoa ferruginea]|uniref:Uncharacterized protein n=1 Tax=Asanoa ferruginea TaxID=53367 RepID=A0A3D9ZQD1_9ACTN|nr:hypothetical protein [Asanoa ferruginea]REF99566.1 hypothetical protein DFJ67_5605 [Asanoa ferruginea]GIF52272.1 hypothetical protein Afe04nite_68110 [Asanoa ferruginea]
MNACWILTAAMVAAGISGPAPEDRMLPVPTCAASVDEHADWHRAQGFTAQAAKSFALIIKEDCRQSAG